MFMYRPDAMTYYAENRPATLAATTVGTNITSGAINTESAWTELIASTARDTWGILVAFNRGGTNANIRSVLCDIGIGAAGSEIALISNLIGNSGVNSNVGFHNARFFPLFIPAGTRLSARVQTNAAAHVLDVIVRLIGAPDGAPYMPCAGVETLGTITGSLFAAVTPGASGAFGSWTTIGTTVHEWKGFTALFQTANNATQTNQSVHAEIGYSSVALVTHYASFNTGEVIGNHAEQLPCMQPIPAGTIMQVRIRSSIASPQAIPCAIYGLF